MLDVIVVGAGPGGCSVATLLAKNGFEVLLLDRARFPRDKPCGEYVSPGAYPILQRLGVWPEIEAMAPRRLHGMVVTTYNGTRFVGEFPADGSLSLYKGRGFGMRRMQFDHLLIRNALKQGVQLQEGFVVTDLLLRGGKGCRDSGGL